MYTHTHTQLQKQTMALYSHKQQTDKKLINFWKSWTLKFWKTICCSVYQRIMIIIINDKDDHDDDNIQFQYCIQYICQCILFPNGTITVTHTHTHTENMLDQYLFHNYYFFFFWINKIFFWILSYVREEMFKIRKKKFQLINENIYYIIYWKNKIVNLLIFDNIFITMIFSTKTFMWNVIHCYCYRSRDTFLEPTTPPMFRKSTFFTGSCSIGNVRHSNKRW